MTFEDFLNYICKKSEWLYRKLQLIYKQFKDVVEDCNIWLAEAELSRQSKDSKIVLIKNWLNKTIKCLNQITLDQDVYINKITYNTLHPVDYTTADG